MDPESGRIQGENYGIRILNGIQYKGNNFVTRIRVVHPKKISHSLNNTDIRNFKK